VTPRAGQETELRADAVRNRARILRIARGQLAAGDTSLQLNAIARLAGVGVGTVYRHFPNRHALVEALSAERLLLDRLQAAAPSRIVNVTSAAVKAARRTFDAAEPPGGYYGFHWYGRAKLANLPYTLHLAERLRGTRVTVFAADPGGAATSMTDGTMTSPKIVSLPLRVLWPLVRRTFARATAGPASVAASPSVFAATDASLDGQTGVLIGPGARPVPVFRGADDLRTIEKVLDLSRRLASLDDGHGAQHK
jgi:AcrR family transcriptional regulator